jgi:hypothetical protein
MDKKKKKMKYIVFLKTIFIRENFSLEKNKVL